MLASAGNTNANRMYRPNTLPAGCHRLKSHDGTAAVEDGAGLAADVDRCVGLLSFLLRDMALRSYSFADKTVLYRTACRPPATAQTLGHLVRAVLSDP